MSVSILPTMHTQAPIALTAMRSDDAIDTSEGFSKHAFPAAMAAAKGIKSSWKGKFHGEMIVTTPRGSFHTCNFMCVGQEKVKW